MELHQLKLFVEVMRQGGFTQAARKLNTTQSTISKAVKQLEDEVGFCLLQRSTTGRKPQLTEAGEAVFRHATSLLLQCDDMTTELADIRSLRRGTLRLGVPPIGSSLVFASMYAAYRQRYPNVDIVLTEHGSRRLETLLMEGSIDLAASLLPVSDQFDAKRILQADIDLIVSVNHPMAMRKSLTWSELKNEPLILFGNDFAITPLVEKACAANGFAPKVAATSQLIDFVIELVATQVGVSFLPRSFIEQRHHERIKNIPLLQPCLNWDMAMIWRRGGYLSHAAQAWLDMISEKQIQPQGPLGSSFQSI